MAGGHLTDFTAQVERCGYMAGTGGGREAGFPAPLAALRRLALGEVLGGCLDGIRTDRPRGILGLRRASELLPEERAQALGIHLELCGKLLGRGHRVGHVITSLVLRHASIISTPPPRVNSFLRSTETSEQLYGRAEGGGS